RIQDRRSSPPQRGRAPPARPRPEGSSALPAPWVGEWRTAIEATMLPPMSESLYLIAAGCLLAGLVLGAAATRWLALRREQALRIELAVLQSQVKTQEELERERAA